MLTSGPFWAMLISIFADGWYFYFNATSLPTFLRSYYGLDFTTTTVITALSFLAMLLFMTTTAYSCDWLIARFDDPFTFPNNLT